MQDSPPPFTSQLNMQVPRLQEDPRLITKDEKKFRKEIYRHNSSLKRACLYYRDQATRDALNKMEKERDEDGKRCPICLDDFESGQEVMLTPCNHMFHEDCIMPWVKSNSQCPVCRYAFSEQMRERASNLNNNNNIATNHLTTSELISIARAMQEAFLWGNGAR